MTVRIEPLPMAEAQQFWRDKVKLGPGEFAKLSDEAKVKAFAISGIAKGNELDTVCTALQRAIDQGTTFEQFKKDCGDIFERRGWTGKRAWRVDNIFRTNIQTAYNVGHYKQLKDDGSLLPYWRYSAINDSRTRPTHLAMDGRVWPAEHPMWDTWFPPNGYRCRCSVTGLTKSQVARRGLKVEEIDPTNTLIEPVDPHTGNRMPARQLLPDQGFAHKPGKVVHGWIVEQQTKDWHRFRPLDNLRGPQDYRRPALEKVRPATIPDLDASMLLPSGLSDAEYAREFVSRYGEELVVSDAIGEPVILSLRPFQVVKEGEGLVQWKFSKPGHGAMIPLIKVAIEQPFEIWLTPQKDGSGKVRLSRRYVCLWKTEDKERVGGLMVFEVAGGVLQGVTAYMPLSHGAFDLDYVERQRRGLLLYPAKGR